MSSKVKSSRSSFLDWENSLKLNQNHGTTRINFVKMEKSNSLGVSDDEFRDFLKKWKEQNLSL